MFDKNIYMREALKEAEVALQINEVPIGAVIVDERKQIIARAHNLVLKYNNPLMHAEMIAIYQACNAINYKSLGNCDLYVTLEPCAMCASAIALAKIKRLFYGAENKKYGAVVNGLCFFNHSSSCYVAPEIYEGILVKESQKLLEQFFHQLR